MKYHISTQAHYTVIYLTGEVDLQYSPQAREQILKHLQLNQHVLVDLSKVEYIDSSGVASLVEGYQVAKSKNVQFGLLGVSNSALQVLQLARLDRVFPIYSSMDEVLSRFL